MSQSTSFAEFKTKTLSELKTAYVYYTVNSVFSVCDGVGAFLDKFKFECTNEYLINSDPLSFDNKYYDIQSHYIINKNEVTINSDQENDKSLSSENNKLYVNDNKYAAIYNDHSIAIYSNVLVNEKDESIEIDTYFYKNNHKMFLHTKMIRNWNDEQLNTPKRLDSKKYTYFTEQLENNLFSSFINTYKESIKLFFKDYNETCKTNIKAIMNNINKIDHINLLINKSTKTEVNELTCFNDIVFTKEIDDSTKNEIVEETTKLYNSSQKDLDKLTITETIISNKLKLVPFCDLYILIKDVRELAILICKYEQGLLNELENKVVTNMLILAKQNIKDIINSNRKLIECNKVLELKLAK